MSVSRIKLKDHSPEFVDDKPAKPKTRTCEMDGCRNEGEFRAPKDRSLQCHYWFCEAHIRDYNAAWNFFSGMSDTEVEQHVRRSMLGDRPTWIYSSRPEMAEQIRARASSFRDFETEFEPKKPKRAVPKGPEAEALEIMGLAPPITYDEIKARYKELAKRHHPDANAGDPASEEMFKRINMAYTILKAAHEKFAVLE